MFILIDKKEQSAVIASLLDCLETFEEDAGPDIQDPEDYCEREILSEIPEGQVTHFTRCYDILKL